MKHSRSVQPKDVDARCLAVAGTISIYSLGGATAFGRDYFIPLLASYVIMIALLARDFLKNRSRASFPRSTQPLPTVLGLFAIALVLTNILVQTSGLRSDVLDINRQVSMLLLGMLPFVLAYRVARRQGAGIAILLMAHAVMAICALSIGLEATGIISFESYGDRHFGFLSDPAALLLTFPFVVYAANGRRAMLTLSLVLLILTLSRGPIFLAIFGISILAAFGQGRARVEVFLMTGIGLLIAFIQSYYVEILAQRFSEIDYNDGRFITSEAGLNLFKESPLYGHGYAALSYYYPAYDDFWAQIYGRYRDGVFPTASSTWVQILSDGGLLLAIPYFVLITLTAFYCLPRIRGWLKQPCTQAVAGGGVWLILVFYVHHSSAWFLAGGPVLPLIMALLGALAGTKVFEQARTIIERNQMMAEHSR